MSINVCFGADCFPCIVMVYYAVYFLYKDTGWEKRMRKKIQKIVLSVLVIIALFAGILLGYAAKYYHAVNVDKYLQSNEKITVEEISEGLFFDGAGTREALIFYPGAKVEFTAYAPLMYKLAEQGIDCFLLKMPLNMAVFDPDKAEEIQKKYKYEIWDLAGHSMGGAMAANYLAGSRNTFDRLILLAAYPTKDLTETELSVLSLYGDRDQVVKKEKLEAGRTLMPKDYTEYCISGGNHAGFGSYGSQKGDGEAELTQEEQWDITVQKICRSAVD